MGVYTHDSFSLNLYFQAHLIDFGCAKFYWQSQKTRQHIPFKTGKLGLRGSARFVSFYISLAFIHSALKCSNNAHLGNELSRRDDMISLGYTIAYLLRNPLPWQKSSDQGDQTNHKGFYYNRIAAVKLQYNGNRLFEGFPPEFGDYMTVRQSPKVHFFNSRFSVLRKATI